MRLIAPKFWESYNGLALLLLPLTMVYGAMMYIRRLAYRLHLLSSVSLPVPLIIVGNIRIGGTGKTPLVIALAQALQKMGFQPGVISRGYLSKADQAVASREVLPKDTALEVGDEPALMAQHLAQGAIPVWIGRNRSQTALSLLAKYPNCNLIICDDGLQHYALARYPVRHGGHDIEIVVQDGRLNGNGWMLPSGPLRELSHRGRDLTIEMVIQPLLENSENPNAMHGNALKDELNRKNIDPQQVQHITATMGHAYWMNSLQLQEDLKDSKHLDASFPKSLSELANQFVTHYGPEFHVVAIAGIANPEKFFTPLRQIFPQLSTQSFPDHEDFSSNPFAQFPTNTYQLVLITEKDAVKCRKWSDDRVWVVPLEARIPDSILLWMQSKLRR